jgi:outer membrane immunogenic protein
MGNDEARSLHASPECRRFPCNVTHWQQRATQRLLVLLEGVILLMKQLAIVISIVAILTESRALAADMATKTPPLPAPASSSWAGWYAGGNIGYGWGDVSSPNLSFADPAGVGFAPYFAAGGNVTPNLRPLGAIGGGQLGYNWALRPNWIAGIVADFQGSNTRASATNTVTPPTFAPTDQANSERLDWFGTIRAKLGFALNNWLPYATGGLAYGHVTTAGSLFIPGGVINFIGTNQTTQIGWTAGAGMNYAIAPHWVIGVEYLHIDLGRTTYTETQPTFAPGSLLAISNRAAEDILRATLDYKL